MGTTSKGHLRIQRKSTKRFHMFFYSKTHREQTRLAIGINKISQYNCSSARDLVWVRSKLFYSKTHREQTRLAIGINKISQYNCSSARDLVWIRSKLRLNTFEGGDPQILFKANMYCAVADKKTPPRPSF